MCKDEGGTVAFYQASLVNCMGCKRGGETAIDWKSTRGENGRFKLHARVLTAEEGRKAVQEIIPGKQSGKAEAIFSQDGGQDSMKRRRACLQCLPDDAGMALF